MVDGSTSRDESRVAGDVPLDRRIDLRAESLRGAADLMARAVCKGDPPSWGDVVDWLDDWSLELRGWASEVRGLADEAKTLGAKTQ